jgi:hypothetical protein
VTVYASWEKASLFASFGTETLSPSVTRLVLASMRLFVLVTVTVSSVESEYLYLSPWEKVILCYV